MIDDDDDRPLPALGSAARPQPAAARQMCPAGGRLINPQTGECACCSD